MSASTKNPRASVGLETLEDRLALSALINSAGNLVITETGAHVNAVVSHHVVGGNSYYVVTENGVGHRFAESKVWGGLVVFYGTSGNDYFRNDTKLHAVAGGGDGKDYL